MKYKICFLSGAYRTVEADHYVADDRLLVFMKDSKPVFTAVLENVCYLHLAADAESQPGPIFYGARRASWLRAWP